MSVWGVLLLLGGLSTLSAEGLSILPSELGELRAIFLKQEELCVSLRKSLRQQRRTIAALRSSSSRQRELLEHSKESVAKSQERFQQLRQDLEQTKESLERLQNAQNRVSRSSLAYSNEAGRQIEALEESLTRDRRRLQVWRGISVAAVCTTIGALVMSALR